MKAATLGKFVVLGAVAVSTWWLTSKIVAQTRASRKKTAEQTSGVRAAKDEKRPRVTTASKSLKVLEPGVAPAGFDDGIVPPSLVNSANIESIEVLSDGPAVGVSVGARIIETQDMIYVWSLRVHNQAGAKPKLISERYYREQVFKVTPGEFSHPTFNERFELAPGVYKVVVSLHRVPLNFDLAKLGPPETKPPGTILISGSRKITVTD
jgi:hypothetical protein